MRAVVANLLLTAHQARKALRWAVLLVPMAVLVGTVCAAFLAALDSVTRARFAQPWLLYALPLAGALVAAVYQWLGKSAEAGNNLILDEIHQPGGGVPLRMAPLIFAGTVITHLCGGSAGREGTAVQLGGSLASATARLARLRGEALSVMLMAGIAAGFGAVFGTPLAGAVFALEVLAVGRLRYAGLIPCLVAALVADWACRAWGIQHTAYRIANGASLAPGAAPVDLWLVAKAALAGVAFGLTSLAFAEANHTLGAWLRQRLPNPALRALVGGLVIIALTLALGTRAYLGLGVWSPDPAMPTIARLIAGPPDQVSWAIKLVFTVITLSCGFKGGEVTPLFFIGAGLGNALAAVLGAPQDLFAALGFVAVFAGAANTPLACAIMGIELFGAGHMVPIAVACFVAYACSGHNGIYLSQRLAVAKRASGNAPQTAPLTLREARAARRSSR